MRIYLVGMMGSGKSTIGQMLSKYMEYQFVDLDQVIVEKTGKSISNIFTEHGEAFFRQQETDALMETAQLTCTVIATGGGAIMQLENQKFLKQACTIFLDGSADLLFNRVSGDANRPLATTKAQFVARLEERSKGYEACARHVVNIDGKSKKDIVAEILFLLSQENV